MDEKANYLTTGPAPAEALALLELRARGCVMAGWGPLSELLVPLAELLTLFDKLAAAETAAASVAAERDHWKQEARAHASRATVMELGHCNGQCGICNGECEPPASAPVAPVAGVAAGEVAQEGGSRG